MKILSGVSQSQGGDKQFEIVQYHMARGVPYLVNLSA
jgi:hypothetical protein